MLFWLTLVIANAIFLAFHIDHDSTVPAAINGAALGFALAGLLVDSDGV